MNPEIIKVVRPFNIATKDDVSEAAQDFITYIMSADGQKIIEDNGYISVGDKPAYEAAAVEGKVVVSWFLFCNTCYGKTC